MARAVHTQVPRTDRRTNLRIAFAIFVGPVAWTVHQLVGVTTTGRSCPQATLTSWQWTTLWLVTALAAGLTVAGIAVAYRIFRNWSRDARLTRAEGWDRVEFLTLMGMFIGGFLLLNIIYFGFVPLLVAPCVTTY